MEKREEKNNNINDKNGEKGCTILYVMLYVIDSKIQIVNTVILFWVSLINKDETKRERIRKKKDK